jgi:hypothetical protein
VIVRISNEGQYELQDGSVEALNELDNEAVAACEATDEAHFRQTFEKLLELVRSQGRPLNDDELVESDVILPPADITLDEAKSEFTGEGLIPG